MSQSAGAARSTAAPRPSAALDGGTPNRDAQTVFENFTGDQVLDGLFDIGGNVLPGGNAPILQIKKVIEGSVVGAANSARDVMQTGIRPSDDTDRIVATMNVKNWIPAAGGVAPGQLTGMIFGDGTQANFLRIVFGSVNGAPGFEVGYEIGDAGYATLARVSVPGPSRRLLGGDGVAGQARCSVGRRSRPAGPVW